MKKNYIYLLILIFATVIVTLLFSYIYNQEVIKTSYLYEKLNKITAPEFDGYMIEHPDTIIYIEDKTNLHYDKFGKNWVKKLEKLNLLENVIYIEKEEMVKSLQKKIEESYSYKYVESDLPVIIVVNNGEILGVSKVDESTNIDTIIDYEAFE